MWEGAPSAVLETSISQRRRQPPARVLPPVDGVVIGPPTGFTALEQSLLEIEPRTSTPRATGAAEEALFVVSGSGRLRSGGKAHVLEPESGAVLGPQESYVLEAGAEEVLRVVAVRVPLAGELGSREGPPAPPGATVHRLSDQEAAAATSDREFRIVADPARGLSSATHFVGYIPPVRAPDHFHTYDEVIYVLDGEGALHVGGESHPVAAGSSIQLPARTVHCLENTADTVMRVVAVFRPAGSPAAAYYPDGTPAFAAGSPPPEEEE